MSKVNPSALYLSTSVAIILLLATVAASADTRIAFSSDRTGTLAIFTMNPDGSDLQFLTDNDGLGASQPEWSPDGTWMAFTSDDDIWIMNGDGTGARRLTVHPARDSRPAISPDGQRIAFVTMRNGASDVYVIAVDGTGEARLTDHPALDADPDWSPHGTEIVFHSRRNGTDEVHIMEDDGTNVRQVTPGNLWTACEAWSPDGELIAFGALGQLRWIKPDGTGLVQLTHAIGPNNCPSWSPDSHQIVFQSRRNGNWEIYRINADGSGTTRLTSNSASDQRPEWSPELHPLGPPLACRGFDPPLHRGRVVVRGQRALPLKARLFDKDGLEVAAVDLEEAPTLQVWYKYGTPDAVDVTDAIEAVGEGTQEGQFVYVDGRWRFNLKTVNFRATGTYTVSMRSGHPEEYVVDPPCAVVFVQK